MHKYAPTDAQCRYLTSARAQFNYNFVDPKPGFTFCLNTSDSFDHEVFVEVKKVDANGVETYATIWEPDEG